MKHETTYDVRSSANVLSVQPIEVASFLRECVKNRSLSWLIGDLNRSVLSGDQDEREEARKALEHLGFI